MVPLYTDKVYTSAFFVALVIFLLPLNAFGGFIQLLELIKILRAKKDPKLLLSPQFDSWLRIPIVLFGFLQVLSLINLFFIPLWADWVAEEATLYPGPRTTRETVLLVIWYLLITMTACILVFIAYMVVKGTQARAPVAAQKEAIKEQLKAAAPMSYADLGKETTLVCGLCYAEFADADSVVKLGCNEEHVYHRGCMEQQLELADGFGELNKCVQCKEAITFV